MTDKDKFYKYVEVINAWFKGSLIQIRGHTVENDWEDVTSKTIPGFHSEIEYRIKPKSRRFRIAVFNDNNPYRVAIVWDISYKAYETHANFSHWLEDGKEWEIE